MLQKLLKENTDNLYRQRSFFFLLSIILIICNLFLSIKLLSNNTKVVMMPYKIDSPMEISDSYVSKGYLSSVGYMYISILMDLNESNIDSKKAFILHNSTDSNYRDMCNYFDSHAQVVKKQKISTFFTPQKWLVNEQNLTISVEGRLNSRFGKEGEDSQQTLCNMAFDLVGGVLKLKSFKLEEVKE